MPLPTSCPHYPADPADFTRRQLYALRSLLAASSAHKPFKYLARGVDIKRLSKFVRYQDNLDYPTGGPLIQAVFAGVYEFLKRDAPDALRLDLDAPISLVYMPARANLFEDYSRNLHAMYHVPDVVDSDEQRRLQGIFFVYRYGEIIDGEPTIVKSVMMIEAKKQRDHTYLFFKLIYPSTYYLPDADRWPKRAATSDDKRSRVHGLVLSKQKHLYFQGRDRNGNVPYLIVADHPYGRADHIHSLFIRSATSGLTMASKLLFVRQAHGAIDMKAYFKSLYPQIGVFPAGQLAKSDALSSQLWAMDNTVGTEHGTAVNWQSSRPDNRNNRQPARAQDHSQNLTEAV